MKVWQECDENWDLADRIQLCLSGIALFLVILSGMFFFPHIMKHVKGFKKMTILLQQLSLSFHLLLIVLHRALATQSIFSYFEFSNLRKDYKDKFGDYDLREIGDQISFFFSQYLFAQYYFFSLIQCMDVYVMVCKPFDYEEFSRRTHLCTLKLKGVLACLLYSSQYLIAMVLPILLSSEHSPHIALLKRMDIKWWMHVFYVVKLLLCKLIYTMVVMSMAKMIKTSLKVSNELVNNQKNLTVHKRLYKFALIPVFLNFFFVPYESLNAFFSFYYFGKKDCSDETLFSLKVTVQILHVFTLSAASGISYGAYVLLFSNLRKSLRCDHWLKSNWVLLICFFFMKVFFVAFQPDFLRNGFLQNKKRALKEMFHYY